MTRTTWCLVGLGALVLLLAWSFRDYATLWRGRWQPYVKNYAPNQTFDYGSRAAALWLDR